MKKNVFLNIILILIVLVTSIALIISILNKKNVETIASTNNEDRSAYEFEVKEVDVIEEEPENSQGVISIPELTPGIYYIKVNNEMNTVTIYIQDENGEYTIPVKAMICSTGEDTFKNSKFVLGYKRWLWKPLFGDVYGQYTTHISGNILFHSVPYVKNYDPSSLEYWEYDKLGTTASAGCVRLKVKDAKWIYDNCLSGTIVEFYSDSDPGPLGKPILSPISEFEEYRNWDPTDPNTDNPWKNAKEDILFQ